MNVWELTHFSITKLHHNKLFSEMPHILFCWYFTVNIKNNFGRSALYCLVLNKKKTFRTSVINKAIFETFEKHLTKKLVH